MITVVERELYTIPEAARILRLPPSTLRWWLEGRDAHPPVIRARPTGSANVTWGEFVEAGLLGRYRREGVSLQHLRRFVDQLRHDVGVPYPLAHAKPLVGPGLRLVLAAQHEAGLDQHPFAYEALSGQLLLEPSLAAFVANIDFAANGSEEPWAIRLHPAGRGSPVVIDPELAFGAPNVGGVRTEAIAELLDAGEQPEDISDDYDLELATVKAAAAYEWAAAA